MKIFKRKLLNKAVREKVKGFGQKAVAAAMTALMATSSLLGIGAQAAYAVTAGEQVYIQTGDEMYYYGGSQWGSRMFEINGEVGYCSDPSRNTPASGWYTASEIQTHPAADGSNIHDPQAVVSLLYFGYGGPGWNAQSWLDRIGGYDLDGHYFEPGKDWDGSDITDTEWYLYTHILIADRMWCNGAEALFGCTEEFCQWYAWNFIGYTWGHDGSTENPNAIGPWQYMWGTPEGFHAYQIDTGYNDLAGLGNRSQTIVTFEYTPSGTMSIQKTTGNGSITDGNGAYDLSGAVYGIYSDQGCSAQVSTMTTDGSGAAQSGELDAGTYYVKEITPSEGFDLDQTTYTVVVTGGQNTVVNGGTVSEPPLNDPTGLLVQKVDADTGEPVAQGGGSLEGTEYTYCFFAGDNYTKTDENTIVNGDGDVVMDADGGFEGDQPDRTWVVATDSYGYADLSDQYLVAGESDDLYYVDGIATLPLGTVVVRETDAPDGYRLSDDVYAMQIADGGDSVAVTGDVVVIDGNRYIGDGSGNQNDEVMRGGVTVRKQDSELGASTPQGDATLRGTSFEIVNRSSGSVNVNGTDYQPGEVVATIESDASGIARTGSDVLPIGSYEVREAQPPTGYTANDAWSQNFTISSDGQVVDLTASTYALGNEVIRGGVSLRKVDAELRDALPLGDTTLAGARIEIVNESDHAVRVNGVDYQPGQVVMTLTTDESGNCGTRSDALPYGTYSASEVSVPEGYLLNEDWNPTFQIRTDGQVVDLTSADRAVPDQVIRGDVAFVKVDGLDMDRLAGIPFLVTSQTTGESHVIVSDENGEVSTSADFVAHTSKTNANDDAVTDNGDGTYTVDEDVLDASAGVWFSGRTDRTTSPDDSLGALPYDTYTFQELRVSANEDYDLVSFNITISRNDYTVNGGTVDDNYLGIGTNATADDGGKQLMVGESVVLNDEVLYEGLTPGDSYTLVGTLMDKETGEAVTDADGDAVTSTVEFTPVQISGSQMVAFTFDTTGIAGHEVVAYERLYNAEGDLIASHEDIDDEGQTVEVVKPEVGTTAASNGGKQVMSGESVTLTDTVSYSGLNPGETYTVEGTVHVRNLDDSGDAADGGVLTDADGDEVKATAEFTPETSDGTVEVTFTIDTTDLAGQTLVVFERVLSASGNVVGTHEDIDDEGQTVEVVTPEIGTSAASADGGKTVLVGTTVTITDTVSYSGLNPGENYSTTGTLMDKETGEAITDADGNEITSTVIFTPNTPDGTIDVDFTFDTTELAGSDIVVFEDLMSASGKVIASHEDIDDEGQTVEVVTPEIGTSAMSADSDKNVLVGETVTLTDYVKYSGLNPGETYTATGTLMDKETGEAIVTTSTETVYEIYDAETGEWEKAPALGRIDNGDGSWTDNSLVQNEDGSWTLSLVGGYTGDDNAKSYATNLVYGENEVRTTQVRGDEAAPVTSTVEFIPETSSGVVEVTFTIDTTELMGKDVVVFERVLAANGNVVGTHEDINDDGQTVEVATPEVGTTATGYDGEQTVMVGETATLTDTVSYSGLNPGETYTVEGTVHVRDYDDEGNSSDGGALVDENGDEVKATAEFAPETSDGTVEVTFTIDTTDLAGQTLVVFERVLSASGKVVGTHEDIDDEGQTVVTVIPTLHTTATSTDEDKSLNFDHEVTLGDTVQYTGLNPGETYTVEGTVMDKETGEPLTFAEGSTGYEVYDESTGEWVTLKTGHIDNVDGSWTQVTVTAKEDGGWTVTTERGSTDSDETITESVDYTEENMRVAEIAGEPLTSTVEFTPESPDGTVAVEFTFDTTTLGGRNLVVFENVYSASGKLVASHEDIDDEGQTVIVDQPAIGTELTDSTDGDHEATPSTSTTLIDTVTYTGLVPGRSYRVEGTLMDQATNQPILVNDQEVTAETTFVPNQSDGTVELAFTFDSTGLEGCTNVVAFEHLFYDDLEIATHADISDMSQTVEITETPDGQVLDKTGGDTATIAAIVAAAAIVVAALIGYGAYQKRKGAQKPDGDDPEGNGPDGTDADTAGDAADATA